VVMNRRGRLFGNKPCFENLLSHWSVMIYEAKVIGDAIVHLLQEALSLRRFSAFAVQQKPVLIDKARRFRQSTMRRTAEKY